MSILTNFVAELGAVVGEELQGGLAVGAALGDIRLDLAGIGTTDGLRIGWVGLVAINHQTFVLNTTWPLIPSIPSNLPDDLENAGRSLDGVGGHNVSQSHHGDDEDGLVEEHDERLEIVGLVKDCIQDRTASQERFERTWS